MESASRRYVLPCFLFVTLASLTEGTVFIIDSSSTQGACQIEGGSLIQSDSLT